MTTVNIPQRLKQIIERQVYLDYDKVLQDAYDCIENDNLHNPTHYIGRYSYNDNFSTALYASIETHDDDCDDYPYDTPTIECGCINIGRINNINLKFHIKYNDTIIHSQSFDITELKNFGIGVEESEFPEYFAHRFFETIPDSVILCVCGDKADTKAKDKCRRCYLNSYTRTEKEGGDCSICLENKGVWFKTHCGHIFHQHCLLTALKEKRQCPLCRTPIPNCIHAGGQVNPYNV